MGGPRAAPPASGLKALGLAGVWQLGMQLRREIVVSGPVGGGRDSSPLPSMEFRTRTKL